MSKNHHTKQFRVMRSVAIWVHDFTCFFCKQQSDSLHVHHIDRNSNNNDIVNLMPLCMKCHTMVHRVNYTAYFKPKHIITLLLKQVNKMLARR